MLLYQKGNNSKIGDNLDKNKNKKKKKKKKIRITFFFHEESKYENSKH